MSRQRPDWELSFADRPSEISTPRTKTHSRGPRIWAPVFDSEKCNTDLTVERMRRLVFRDVSSVDLIRNDGWDSGQPAHHFKGNSGGYSGGAIAPTVGLVVCGVCGLFFDERSGCRRRSIRGFSGIPISAGRVDLCPPGRDALADRVSARASPVGGDPGHGESDKGGNRSLH